MQKFHIPKYKRPLGLYIHIPFCAAKCAYCDFYSLPGAEKRIDRYLAALEKQMQSYRGAALTYLVDTVYIGGGTPSLLSPAQWKRLFQMIRSCFTLAPDAEITAEINPASGSRRRLKAMKKCGVNRLSIGLQSIHEKELAALGRLHRYPAFEETLAAARDLGFVNIGADLMYGIPEQTPESFRESLRVVSTLPLTHISVYGLTIEEGTPFAARRGALSLPDEDTERAMYFDAVRLLEAAGFRQDEISNFSRPGFASRHNLKYWNCDEYLGLGPAAASYFEGLRFTCVRDLAAYIAVMEGKSDANLFPEREEAPQSESIGDYVMLRLRLTDGIDLAAFERRFRRSFEEMFGAKLKKYEGTPYLRRTERGYALTPEGFYVSNTILADLLDIEA